MKFVSGKAVSQGRACLRVVAAVALGACASSPPENAFRLEESALDIRAMQTRSYAVPSETALLAATVGALQDMEYNIDALEKSLGIVSASKASDVDSAAQIAGLILLDVICLLGGEPCGAYATARDAQTISLTMIVLPSLGRSDEFTVRVTMQRAVFDKQGRILTLENISDADIYRAVFDKLQSSLYLQGEIR